MGHSLFLLHGYHSNHSRANKNQEQDHHHHLRQKKSSLPRYLSNLPSFLPSFPLECLCILHFTLPKYIYIYLHYPLPSHIHTPPLPPLVSPSLPLIPPPRPSLYPLVSVSIPTFFPSITHSLTPSLTHPPTHSLTPSPTLFQSINQYTCEYCLTTYLKLPSKQSASQSVSLLVASTARQGEARQSVEASVSYG